MKKEKKMILIGPPGSGKTTLSRVFFKRTNPLSLLTESLPPTRGINSNIFILFGTKLGIFDLAGQENDDWLYSNQCVFEKANIIICMFDIRNSVESIVSFLIEILKKKKSMDSLGGCEIYALLHKIDLFNNRYVSRKIEAIHGFFKGQYKTGERIKIFGTSIEKEYLLDTFSIMLDIIKVTLKKNLIPINRKNYRELKKIKQILTKLDSSKKYKLEKIKSKLRLEEKYFLSHLNKLEQRGFLNFDSDKRFVELTTFSKFIRQGLIERKLDDVTSQKHKTTELFQTLLEIKEVPTDRYNTH